MSQQYQIIKIRPVNQKRVTREKYRIRTKRLRVGGQYLLGQWKSEELIASRFGGWAATSSAWTLFKTLSLNTRKRKRVPQKFKPDYYLMSNRSIRGLNFQFKIVSNKIKGKNQGCENSRITVAGLKCRIKKQYVPCWSATIEKRNATDCQIDYVLEMTTENIIENITKK